MGKQYESLVEINTTVRFEDDGSGRPLEEQAIEHAKLIKAMPDDVHIEVKPSWVEEVVE